MLNVDTPSVVLPSARKGTYTILGYDRARGGSMAGARQKSALRLLAASAKRATSTWLLRTTCSTRRVRHAAQHGGAGRGCHPARGKKIVMKACSAVEICKMVRPGEPQRRGGS